jgi:maltose alpha-D-glucosyltransferase / alpha-amylase
MRSRHASQNVLPVNDDEADCTLVNLLSEGYSYPEKNGRYRILFEPYGYRWFRICGWDYLLKRSATNYT